MFDCSERPHRPGPQERAPPERQRRHNLAARHRPDERAPDVDLEAADHDCAFDDDDHSRPAARVRQLRWCPGLVPNDCCAYTPTLTHSCVYVYTRVLTAWCCSRQYNGGQQVVYNGRLYTAKWWTYNSIPGGSVGDWQDNGACTSFAKATATAS